MQKPKVRGNPAIGLLGRDVLIHPVQDFRDADFRDGMSRRWVVEGPRGQ